MAIIDEKTAWKILRDYSIECSQIDGESLIAIYAIGSLPGGYYRPGYSDIDAVMIVTEGSEKIWGNNETRSERLTNLNSKYENAYDIPKSFGPVLVRPSELYPPYNPEKELTLEIARLKIQGNLIYGEFPLDNIPMPAREDFINDFKNFEDYLDNEFFPEYLEDRLTLTQCTNIILMYLNRYLNLEHGIIQFDKKKAVPLCMEYDEPFFNQQVFGIVERYLQSEKIEEEEIHILREYAVDLRNNMNTFLGIR